MVEGIGIARVVKNLRTVFVEEDKKMNFKRNLWSVASLLAAAIVLLHLAFPATARAQASLTTGAIAGTVTDPTGAVIPHATVTATNEGTNASRSATSGANGGYVVPLLDPGDYKVTVKAAGFRTAEQGPITVIVSQTLDLNFKLELGTATQVVEVTGAAPLLQTTNPNTTSTLGAQQIENIPNPGMDLSYEANFAPGAIMNTTGGYGNVEYNGLPAVSNNFTIDGLDANDPFLNLNNSGATNLQLGLSAMQEVSVNTTSYSADQGRLGASQINFMTKSGTNNVHGNLWETWNGSKLNSADFFINSHQFENVPGQPASVRKPRSNVNQFGGSIGGPIIHDKLFFFGDFEEIKIALPIVGNTLTPTSNYWNTFVIPQLSGNNPNVPATVTVTSPVPGTFPQNGSSCDYVFDSSDCATVGQLGGFTPADNFVPDFPIIGPQSAEVPLYQSMINIYNTSYAARNGSGIPQAMQGCPIDHLGNWLGIPTGSGINNDPTSPNFGSPNVSTPSGDGCGLNATFPIVNHTYDQFILVKVDQNVNDRNTVWYKFAREHGLQATYTDSISPVFNAVSDQPQYNGEFGWTHTFGPTVVNEFTPGVVWYSAIFGSRGLAKSLATFPIDWQFGPYTGLGGFNFVWPQGRNITQWQLIDNLSWTHGTHTFKFGENLRRVLVSDFDFGVETTPLVIPFDIPEVTGGVTGINFQSFPKSLDEPFGLVNFDVFAQDTYRVKPKLTLTYDIRASWNSDPVNQRNLVARAAGSFYQFPHDLNRPLNLDILTGLSKVFPSTQTIIWQPRAAVAYQFSQKTVFRGGFGVFSDIFPAALSDSMAENPPYWNLFTEGVFGGFFDGNDAIAPNVPNSSINGAAGLNSAFLAGFSNGTLSCPPGVVPPGCLPPVGLSQTEHRVLSPYSMQWTGGVQHQFSTNLSLQLQYVGTRGVQIPYTVGANGFQDVTYPSPPAASPGIPCVGCYSPWPTAAPDQRLSGVTQYFQGANSNYNALQASVNKRFSHGMNFQFNYTWSHCLDTISNGGIFGFGNPGNQLNAIPGDLRRNYGPCDYDYRHAFNGYYTYELPFHAHSRVLNQVVGGWQVSGSVIYHGGQPFSIGSPQTVATGGSIINGSGPFYPNLISGQSSYTKAAVSGVTLPGNFQWLNPNAFAPVVDSGTGLCIPAGTTDFSAANLAAVESISAAACQRGDMQRNFLRGPGFGWSDMFLTKRFKLTERVSFLVSGQAYNFLNHPNFKAPGGTAGVPGELGTLTGFGNISSTASPPTGLLGSFLGGDTSPRMIAFKGQLQF
jgi:carboxypeptidase family protein